MMIVQVVAETDRGRRRRRNEDSVVAEGVCVNGAPGYLLAVADGVGGAPAGATASYLATAALRASLSNTNSPAPSSLQVAFERANRAVEEYVRTDPSSKGMATTLVSALIVDGSAWIANVGDSRAYVLHAGQLTQVTRDHSLVAERVRAGFISEEEASRSPGRNVVTRTIGSEHDLETDIFEWSELHPDDIVLLCSDGLYTMLATDEIKSCLTNGHLEQAVHDLIDLANVKGGYDNIGIAAGRLLSERHCLASNPC